MTHKARVYLQRPRVYIGEIEIDGRVAENEYVKFVAAGKPETGRIDRVVPQNWEKSGTVPTVYVVQGPGT